ncbi:hypothetical protein Tco_0809114 [Tanacetum coccineum]
MVKTGLFKAIDSLIPLDEHLATFLGHDNILVWGILGINDRYLSIPQKHVKPFLAIGYYSLSLSSATRQTKITPQLNPTPINSQTTVAILLNPIGLKDEDNESRVEIRPLGEHSRLMAEMEALKPLTQETHPLFLSHKKHKKKTQDLCSHVFCIICGYLHYTDSEPGRVFWGADEEISDGGIPRVIVLRYDGLPMQPITPPSPDYIPGLEDPQTPPVPQEEDEHEPMFIQAQDPNYVSEPIYPEYIPLEDEHELPAEEQPLPHVDSPTAESPGYVTESDPEEDPEEYEDDETEDGPVNYPMDGGDDEDDDDDDSSRDDADDEDENEDEEEEHLAPADSAVVVPTDELVSPPEGIEPAVPPPSTNITIGARITVRPQVSISLPPEAEVERLLAMTTPSPSPPISLSPPSAGERLARCTTPPAHSSPPHVPSPLLPLSGCPTQIQTLRIASTQALIIAVTIALPSPPLPPPLYISPPVAVGMISPSLSSHLARDYGFVSTVDAEERRHGVRDVGYGIRDTWIDPAEAVPEIAPMTVGEVNTRVTELAKLHEHDTQDLYALLEDAQDSTLDTATAARHQAQMVETLRVMRDMRQKMDDMQAELLAMREQRRIARQPAPDARIPDHQDVSGDADSHV